MKPSPSEWQRLVAAARQAPPDADVSAPYGFSTRVAALAQRGGRGEGVSPFTRFSLRALGLAALVMAVTVAANFKPVMNSFADDVAALSDPVLDAGDSSI